MIASFLDSSVFWQTLQDRILLIRRRRCPSGDLAIGSRADTGRGGRGKGSATLDPQLEVRGAELRRVQALLCVPVLRTCMRE